jgi:hypothetical protein
VEKNQKAATTPDVVAVLRASPRGGGNLLIDSAAGEGTHPDRPAAALDRVATGGYGPLTQPTASPRRIAPAASAIVPAIVRPR